jgi:tripartite-type tricarboxylate transporter receptor subunit TctC
MHQTNAATRTMLSRRLLLSGAGAVALSGRAKAAGYTDRTVKIVTGFAPGGPADVLARLLAGHLGERLSGTFIAENRPGAAGNIACNLVARAEPDGTLLLVHTSAFVINPSLYKRKPYDAAKDFTPLVELATSPNLIFTNPATGLKSLGDVLARAKADPAALSFSSAGIGTPPHLSVELLKLKAGVSLTHVPYPGGGPAVQAVLQNTTPLGCVSMQTTLPFIAAGQLVPLAVTSAKRSPNLPNVPTMIELGFPDFITETFISMVGPAKLPQSIIDPLVQATQSVLRDPVIAKTLFNEGYEVLARGPAELAKRIDTEVPMWRDLIERAGIEQV